MRLVGWNLVSGQWHQYKGKVLEQWGLLTADDLEVIDGRREQLIGQLELRYGWSKDEADAKIATWESTLELSGD